MAADVPLLSSYKRGFVRRRLFHTFTGFKILRGTVPAYVPILQIILWVLPCCICLLSVLVGGEEGDVLAGGGVLCLALLLSSLQLLLWAVKRRSDGSDGGDAGGGNLLNDEDEDGNWGGVDSWARLLPTKQWKINYVLHPVFAGCLSFISSKALDLDQATLLLGSVRGSLLVGFSWISYTVGVQPLITGTIPETATYRHVDLLDLSCLSRPLHLLIIQVCIYIGMQYNLNGDVVFILFILHTLFPLVWTLGILPGFEPTLVWLSEQLIVFGLGGTKTSRLDRLGFSLVLSIIQICVVCLLKENLRMVVIFSSLSGYVLSTNLFGLLASLGRCKKRENHVRDMSVSYDTGKSGKLGNGSVSSGSVAALQCILTHTINMLVISLLSSLLSVQSTSQQRTGSSVVGWTVVVYLCLLTIYREMKKVFTLFGLVRSPVYNAKPNIISTLLNHMYTVLQPSLGAYLGVVYLMFLISTDTVLHTRLGDGFWILQVLELTSILHNFRWIWQNNDLALLEISVYHVIKLLQEEAVLPDLDSWILLSGMEWLVVTSFLRDRLTQLLEKLYFILVLSATSVEDRVSKRPYAIILFQLNIIFFPVVFLFVLISCLLSSPLLPLFSLPVFCLSFPRPSSFWPSVDGKSTGISSDSVYYDQSAYPIMEAVATYLKSGNLGVLQPQDILLLRHEDRIVWIQIDEIGNRYVSMVLRGLELQETSCHTLEAMRIDDILESAFEKKSKLNHFWFHSLTPVTELEVEMYSDTRNLLTGVFTSRETLEKIAETFLESLVWHLVRYAASAKEGEANNVEAHSAGDLVVSFQEWQGNDDPATNEEDQAKDEGNIKLSASIEGLNLNSWPESREPSPWATRPGTHVNNPGRQKLASFGGDGYLRRRESSESSLFDGIEGEEEDEPYFPEIRISHTVKQEPDNQDNLYDISSTLPGIIEPRSKEKFPVSRNSLADQLMLSPAHRPGNLSRESTELSLPDEWLESVQQWEVGEDWFPNTFLSLCIRKENEVAAEDRILLRQYRGLAVHVFHQVYSPGATPSAAPIFGPVHAYRSFRNVAASQLKQNLRMIARDAFRSAVKIALDKVLIEEMSADELYAAFLDLQNNWFLGTETDPRWKSSILSGVKNLFSLQKSESLESDQIFYKSHILSLRPCKVKVGKLCSEVVRGLWSSLSLELLYLTNDDDERYSIQAEERVLRNLTVQAADPPLGYSIYCSGYTSFSR